MKIKRHIIKKTVENIINDAIEKINQDTPISGLYLYMGTIIKNSKEVLEFQRRILETRAKRKKLMELD